MKKRTSKIAYALVGFVCIAFMVNCSKEENLRNLATEKIDQSFKSYDSLMTTAENGWIFVVYPNIKEYNSNKGGFTFFTEFNKDTRTVKMVGDFNDKSATTVLETPYNLKFTSLTTLSFPTYTHIHEVADPNTSISGGLNLGWGNRVDSEFSFLRKSDNNDTIFLKGNLQKCDAMLIRAKPEEKEYLFDQLSFSKLKSEIDLTARGKLGLHVDMGGEVSVMTLSLGNRQVVFAKEVNADSISIHRTGIAYNGMNKMILNEPYVYNGKNIKELYFEDDKVRAVSNTGEEIEVIEKEYPDIPAFKMVRTGAYTSITIPFDAKFLQGGTSENADWPHFEETSQFLMASALSDFTIILGVLSDEIRFYGFNMQFKPKQKRLLLNLNFGILDKDNPDIGNMTPENSDNYFDKFVFPYQYRYIYNSDEVFTMYYEGPQFVYAEQFPSMKDAFKSAINNGDYSLKYTKSPTELLIAFYNKRDGRVLFEGRPF